MEPAVDAAPVEVEAEPEADVAEAVEPEAPEPTPEQTADEFAARIDAARERLRSKIAPPDPED